MAFVEFDGKLDDEQSAADGGYVEFTGKLDPQKGLISSARDALSGAASLAGDAMRDFASGAERVLPPAVRGAISMARGAFAEPPRSVMDGVAAAPTNQIDARGAPVTADYAEGVRRALEVRTPQEREALQRAAKGTVLERVIPAQSRAIEANTAAPAPISRAIGDRRARVAGMRGVDQEAAAALATSDIMAGRASGGMLEARPAYDPSASERFAMRVNDLGVATAKIPATVVKGIADVAQLFTADTVGRDLSSRMKASIDQLDAGASMDTKLKADQFARIMANDNASPASGLVFLLENPGFATQVAIPSMGSMVLPMGAAAAAGRMADAFKWFGTLNAADRAAKINALRTAAVNATAAFQNAADTFQETKASTGDRYIAAAIAGLGTAAVGGMTKGGVEGMLARRMGGTQQAPGLLAAGGLAALNEGLQEGGEAAFQSIGQQVAETGAVNPRKVLKNAAVEGALGGLIGGPMGAMTGVGGTVVSSPQSRAAGLVDIVVPDAPRAAVEVPTAAAPRAAPSASPDATPLLARLDEAARPAGPDAAGRQTAESAATRQASAPRPAGAPAASAGFADFTDAEMRAEIGAPAAPGGTQQPATPKPAQDEVRAEWYGRRGDGYQTQGDARLQIPARRRDYPDLSWDVEALPNGRFKLVGRAGSAQGADNAQTTQSSPAAEGPATGRPGPVAEWVAFSQESGSLGVPRAEMPQIAADRRGALVNFLAARGIAHETEEVAASSLKPTQAEFSPAKVRKAAARDGGDRSILVSSDGHVLDGHHQWVAAVDAGQPVKIMRFDAPIGDLLKQVRAFPSATAAEGAAPDPAPVNGAPMETGDPRVDAPAKPSRADAAKKRRTDYRTKNGFLAFLGENGVSLAAMKGITGETGRRGNRMVPYFGPMFRKNGRPLDELARLAVEAGYLTQADVDSELDNGGVNKLTEMIRRAQAGESVGTASDEELAFEQRMAEFEDGGTDDLDLTPDDYEDAYGDMSADLQARAEALTAELRTLVSEDEFEATIERLAIQNESQQEYVDALEQEVAGRRAARGSQEPEGAQQGRGAPGDRGGAQAGGGASEEFGLEAPTAEGLRARAANEAAQQQDQTRRDAAPPAADFTLTGSDSQADQARARGQMELASGDDAGTSAPMFSRRRMAQNDAYETDLFGNPLPGAGGTAGDPRPARTEVRRDVQPAAGVPGDTEAPAGDYFVRTIVGTEARRKLGADRILTAADAAAATRYLYRSAVERFDGIVTDADGKPLAVVGGFKGALAQAAVYPATIMGEAIRVPGAARIWFSHNHPSGKAALSRADENLGQALANVFRGSGIEPMGILAVAGDEYAFAPANVLDNPERGDIPAGRASAEVPVVEREQLPRAGTKMGAVSSPDAAKRMARGFYAQAKTPGLMLLSAQNDVVAWVPLPKEALGTLRGTGGLRALYRAISEANAGNAILVHGGEMDAAPSFRGGVSAVENIGAALGLLDVRLLDAIDATSGASFAERGMGLSAGPVYSRSERERDAAFVATERAYGGRAGWQRDRDAGRTKLSYGQWVQVRTPAFKAWFGDWEASRANPGGASKAVDPDTGEPMVVYHGTGADFVAFDEAADGNHMKLPGIYFSPDPDIASAFAENDAKMREDKAGRPFAPAGARVMPTYLSMQNPLVEDVSKGGMKGFYPASAIRELIVEAKRRGHDGVILRGWQDGSGPVQYIVFRPEQIKSATGNRGTFDPANADIRESRGGGTGLPMARVTEIADSMRAAWANAPEVVVVRDMRDPAIPQAVRDADAKQRSQGAKGDPEGFWYGGRAYLVASALASDADVVRVLAHEALGHYGLRGVFGKRLASILDQVALARIDEVRAKAAEYGLPITMGDARAVVRGRRPDLAGAALEAAARTLMLDSRRQAAEEVLAVMAQRQPQLGVVQRAIAAVRAWLRETFPRLNLRLSDAEIIRDYILPARTFVERGLPQEAAGDPAFSRSKQTAPKGAVSASGQWDAPDTSRVDDVIYALQDKQVDLKRVAERIKAAGANLGIRTDGYLREELYQGRVADRTRRFLDDELRPLLTSMRLAKVGLDQLEEYLMARHAPEANAYLQSINLERSDNAALSGMSNADAAKIMAAAPPVMESLAARVDDIIAGTRDLMEISGLETSEYVEGLRRAYEFYVPLHRDDDHPGSRAAVGQGFSVRGKSAKGRTGSTARVTNILAHIVEAREATITRAEKNVVALAVYAMAKQNPNPDFWTTETPPEVPWKDERRTVFNPRTGTMDENPNYGQVVMRADPQWASRPNVLAAKFNGAPVGVIFNERDPRALRMVTSLKNLDVHSLDGAMRVMATGTRWQAMVNTALNPVFMVVNFLRDVQGAAINLTSTEVSGEQLAAIGGIGAAARAIWRAERGLPAKDPKMAALYDEFRRRGAKTGYRESFVDIEARAKALQRELDSAGSNAARAITAVTDFMATANDTVENAVRLSVYRVALEKGMHPDRAASVAKNLTVNFNRKGAKTQSIGALYAFFNAAVQGNARLVETLKGPAGKRILAGGLAIGMLQALLLAGADDDDEEAIPDYVKRTSLVFPYRGGYVAIPMPLGLHVIPNVGRAVTEVAIALADGDMRKIPGQIVGLLGTVMDSMNPLGGAETPLQMIAPTLADPVVQLATNQGFSGRPIYRERSRDDASAPGYTLGRDSTNPAYTGAAYVIHMVFSGGNPNARNIDVPAALSPQPEALRLIPETIFGGLWRETEKIVDTTIALATGQPVEHHRIPLVSRFSGDTQSDAAVAGVFWNNISRVGALEREAARAKKAGADDADIPEVGRRASAAKREVLRMMDARRRMEVDGAPRETIREVEREMTGVMREFNAEARSLRR